MLKVTFTNGDIQNIKVTGDFFSVTLAEKNTEFTTKKIKVTPIEKAESLALDLAVGRRSEVSSISLFYPGSKTPKVKTYKPLDSFISEQDQQEAEAKAGPSYIKALKEFKKEWRNKKPSNRWVWNF